MSSPFAAGPLPERDAVVAGIRTLQRRSRAERELLDRAQAVAVEIVTSWPEDARPMREREVISTVAERAGVSDYLASYVVDKLRTIGVVSKDWQTGILQSVG